MSSSSLPQGIDSTIDDNNTTKRDVFLNGSFITTNFEKEKNKEFICPICLELIQEAFVTKCGHTFCFQCISKSIVRFNKCPKCNLSLTKDNLFPNILLDELITKYKTKLQLNESNNLLSTSSSTTSNRLINSTDGLKKILSIESQNLTLPDVNIMLEILNQRKQLLEAESCTSQNRLLREFLKHLLKQKEDQQLQIVREINLVKKDLETVENNLRNAAATTATTSTTTAAAAGKSGIIEPETTDKALLGNKLIINSLKQQNDEIDSKYQSNKSTTSTGAAAATSTINFQSRKRRMYAHFDDFVSSYFFARSKEFLLEIPPQSSNNVNKDLQHADSIDDNMKGIQINTQLHQQHLQQQHGLDLFRENLIKFSRYSNLQSLATIHYSSDLHISSTIVSTIVFDKDNEYFAIGGVTKRIKVYDYSTVIKDCVDIHYPSVEMISGSKISCLAWNSFHKNVLASSDYEGAVNIWDVTTGQRTKCFHEHEKRCWSVDFNEIDARLMVSGSDDSRVKLWSIRDDHSIATLEAKANVCCVKFNPKSSCHLAFGSADHDVHYYDLRNMNKAICVFKGHKKAVSYVKFINSYEIISASTDSQLKLWNINSPPHSLRSFTGHVNEKNFVGLATDRDYIACGSEDNSLYLYYKGLSKQLFNYKVDVNHRASDLERSNDLNEFVSAVCWRKNCDVVLAANSRGVIKILELV